MGRAVIRAITFDLWDTVFIDDSDEPKRAAQGLLPKPAERRNLVHQFLGRHEPISSEHVELAYNTVDAAFHHVWYSQNITWTVRERLSVLLKALKRDLPENEFDELVLLHEEMELEVRPDLAVDVAEAIQNLHGKYKMGVVSDAIFSPGRALRQLLAHYDILKYFETFVFSDTGLSQEKIKSITIFYYARLYLGTVNSCFEAMIRQGQVDYYSGVQMCADTEWDYLSFKYTENPATGLPWTVEEVDNLEAGMNSIEPNAGGSVAQVYVEVEYE